MKRLICAVLTATLLTAALCGCGSGGKESSENASAAKSTSDEAGAATTDETSSKPDVKPTGEKVKVYDSELGEIWITDFEGLKKNTLSDDGFSVDGGFLTYSEDGSRASETGIDVSSFNGDINWESVKNAGVDFVMVRLGGRGYGESGALYKDERALEYISGAQAAGLKAGGYFFSQAINAGEATEEAKYVKEILGDVKLDYPVAFDWEIIKTEAARTDTVNSETLNECALAFCGELKNSGVTPMIYSTTRELYFKYDLTKLAEYGIWLSEYSDVPTFYYQFPMWQYSKTGQVDGIEGAVDLNIRFTNI